MQKFEYILKEKPIDVESDNFLHDYLRSLGVKKTKSFISYVQIQQ